jgi:hypothetical protein
VQQNVVVGDSNQEREAVEDGDGDDRIRVVCEAVCQGALPPSNGSRL